MADDLDTRYGRGQGPRFTANTHGGGGEPHSPQGGEPHRRGNTVSSGNARRTPSGYSAARRVPRPQARSDGSVNADGRGDVRVRRASSDARRQAQRRVPAERPAHTSPGTVRSSSSLPSTNVREAKRRLKTEKYKNSLAKEAEAEKKRNIGIVRVRLGVDHVMLALILTLLCLGTVMVFSASYPSALAQENDSLYYIKRQAVFAVLGVIVMMAASAIPYSFYRRIAVPAYVVSVVLLLLVLVVGKSEGEAKRWLGIPNTSFSIQPSELMKTALVLILAWYLEKNRKYVIDRLHTGPMLVRGVLIPASFVGCACILVLLEKHLSGTIIIGAIGLIVMLIGGVHMGYTLGGFGVAGAGAAGLFLWKNPYALRRITTKMNENADVLREKWQTTQGMYAIGSGGPFGVGIGASRQKFSYVSAAQNDFIFTIWCEEMGFVGAVILIALYLIFIWRGFKIAMHAPDTFSALTVFGIISKVGLQAFLNIAVVCDIIPNTGVSLPFFSYGGSSLIILMAEMGIVLSISKHSYQKK